MKKFLEASLQDNCIAAGLVNKIPVPKDETVVILESLAKQSKLYFEAQMK